MRWTVWGGAVLGLLLLAGAIFAVLSKDGPAPSTDSSAPPASVMTTAGVGLDLMRIEPVGSFVAAGHARPGSRIEIHDSKGATLADGRVDGRGEWLLASREDLRAGDHEFAIYHAREDEAVQPTDIIAVVSVPAVRGPRPLVIALTAGQAPRVLQSPDGPAASAGLVEAASFSSRGALTVGGRADPGTVVYIYLDDTFLGEASADSEGRWVRPGGGDTVSSGSHRIRIDVLSTGGQVVSRGRVEIARSSQKIDALSVREEPKLWRVRRAAGRGSAQELIVFRPGAVAIMDPKPVLPGQMISPQSMPLHGTPLKPVDNSQAR